MHLNSTHIVPTFGKGAHETTLLSRDFTSSAERRYKRRELFCISVTYAGMSHYKSFYLPAIGIGKPLITCLSPYFYYLIPCFGTFDICT